MAHNRLSAESTAAIASHFFNVRCSDDIKSAFVSVRDVGCAGNTKIDDVDFNGGGIIRIGDPWDIKYISVERIVLKNSVDSYPFLKFIINSNAEYYHQIVREKSEEVVYYLEQLESGI